MKTVGVQNTATTIVTFAVGHLSKTPAEQLAESVRNFKPQKPTTIRPQTSNGKEKLLKMKIYMYPMRIHNIVMRCIWKALCRQNSIIAVLVSIKFILKTPYVMFLDSAQFVNFHTDFKIQFNSK